MAITTKAADVWRDYATVGIPASGVHAPSKPDIRQWASEVETAINTQTLAAGGGLYDTLVDLEADLAPSDGEAAWVYTDATAANNGIYRKNGASDAGSWDRVLDLPFAVIPVTISNGDGNAIVGTTALPVPAADMGAILMMTPAADNTGPVTLALNGLDPAPVTGQDGGAMEGGYLAAGALVPLVKLGAGYRTLMDYRAGVFAAAAETAADDAVAESAAAAASAVTASAGATASTAAAAAAGASATAAAAAAAAAAEAIGATLFDTKADADAGLGGLSNGDYAMVLVDEERNDNRTLYVVESAAYVFVRELGDQTLASLTERYGFGRHMRFSLSTIGKLDRDAVGSNGPGNPNDFPTTITASQSGTTVTASATFFRKYHVGAVIRWDSGEWARIVAVSVNEPSTSTTCTVDRSQSVSSGSASVDAKPFVCIFDGDSLGHRISGEATRWGYRACGFGGNIFMPGNVDNTQMMIGLVDVASGASTVINGSEYDEFVYSAYWSVPSSGTLIFSLLNPFSLGSERDYRLGLEIEKQVTDTAIVVWRLGAGSITVQRKRFTDAAWEDVETIADTSSGAGAYGYRKYSHDLRYDWQYRVLGVSGTVKVQALALLNESEPGFVPWRVSRGGDTFANFNTLPSTDLAELCQLFLPDARFAITADGGPTDTDPSDHEGYLQDNRDLWAAAWPYLDTVWMSIWEPTSDEQVAQAYSIAVRTMALVNDDSFVPFWNLFGDYTTQGNALGWIEDGVHPGKLGSLVMWHQVLRITGLADFPQIAAARNVDARLGNFGQLSIRGDDVADQLAAAVQRRSVTERGAKWNYGTLGFLSNDAALGAAIGTGDFTVSLELTVLSTVPASYLAAIGASGSSLSQNGGLSIVQVSQNLSIYLTDGSGNQIEYRYQYFGNIYGGQTGLLTIRSDVANDRFDLFWNGKPILGLVGSIQGNTTSPLGTWSGTGTGFGIPQGNAVDRSTDFFGAMMWRSALSDAEILANYHAARPTTTAPDFWWDFSEGIGRLTEDRTGNVRDGFLIKANPSQYSADAGLTWKYTRHGKLSLQWVASANATTKLIAGDDVIASYTANRDMLLPASASVGDVIRVTVNSTYTIRITQPALTQIKSGASATTIGTGGRIQFGGAADSVTLRCTRAEAGVAFEWVIVAQTGSALTWV